MKDKIKRGTLYILSPANKTGAEDKTRFVRNSGDLNRSFPGDITSEELSERIAAVIFKEMEAKKPDFILDLHEARWELGGHSTGNGLGNTLIYTNEIKKNSQNFRHRIKYYAIETISVSDYKYLELYNLINNHKTFCVIDESLTIRKNQKIITPQPFFHLQINPERNFCNTRLN